jgi:hypothetical protein
VDNYTGGTRNIYKYNLSKPSSLCGYPTGLYLAYSRGNQYRVARAVLHEDKPKDCQSQGSGCSFSPVTTQFLAHGSSFFLMCSFFSSWIGSSACLWFLGPTTSFCTGSLCSSWLHTPNSQRSNVSFKSLIRHCLLGKVIQTIGCLANPILITLGLKYSIKFWQSHVLQAMTI